MQKFVKIMILTISSLVLCACTDTWWEGLRKNSTMVKICSDGTKIFKDDRNNKYWTLDLKTWAVYPIENIDKICN